ncbi:hypothetical protein LWM68_42395 [Niabella sp. W65]|nr:hypothetical protein [Niabella sp. W65]MCH7368799.1 hypothetical protein [Niabella sp. W65]ULT44376.1 hypothetical protein KRR40_14100 [Niabella sp. I65]
MILASAAVFIASGALMELVGGTSRKPLPQDDITVIPPTSTNKYIIEYFIVNLF